MDNEKLVFIDADYSIEKFSKVETINDSGKDDWETEEF